MLTFIISIGLLIVAYFTYGKFVERFFGASSAIATPVKRLADGVDYHELKPWRIFVIQFLNIAGLGPIFGAILGAAYGPMAYVWIVIGCIFMGATHDYFSGMLSIRHDGTSLPDIVGKYLGNNVRKFMTFFTGFLLLAVGVSFVNGPADLLGNLTNMSMTPWLYVIFAYYILATLLPIDKIIGKIYPFMGMALIFMAVAVGGYLIYGGLSGQLYLEELTFDTMKNMHTDPANNILFPMLFIVISCGAISGFHATQSPMMARCMTDEKYGRPIFYGAMISEGIVAMIWATAAMAYFARAGADGSLYQNAAGRKVSGHIFCHAGAKGRIVITDQNVHSGKLLSSAKSPSYLWNKRSLSLTCLPSQQPSFLSFNDLISSRMSSVQTTIIPERRIIPP